METVNAIKSIFPLLEITSEIMNIFGEIKAYTQKIGKTIDDMDLLIAATAITNNFTLVTHNTKHFENIPNLKVEDWFRVFQDFTTNSDIDWSKSVAEIDQQLYRKYGLSEEEVAFIEKMIKPKSSLRQAQLPWGWATVE